MFHSLTELIEKIILGEDATIEFKREMPHRSSLADEIGRICKHPRWDDSYRY